jgi:hypothetical protein
VGQVDDDGQDGQLAGDQPPAGPVEQLAILVRGEVSWDDFAALFEATKQFGEPGFYWVDHPDGIPNPCVEIGFWPLLKLLGLTLDDFPDYQGPVYDQEDGTKAVSGWQMCNLTTINGKTLSGGSKQEKADEFHAGARPRRSWGRGRPGSPSSRTWAGCRRRLSARRPCSGSASPA